MKFLNKIKSEFKKLINFGFFVTFYDILSQITENEKCYQKKHKLILSWLNKHYSSIIEKYACNINDPAEKIKGDCPVWIFWYQGFDNAPDLVKSCVNSVKKNLSGHPINLISKDNLENYFVAPRHIKEKFEKGIISTAHISDILRCYLLAEYGGIWCDATIYLATEIKYDYTNYSFFTIKNSTGAGHYVSKLQWSIFFLMSSRDNLLFKYMRDMLYEYWADNDIVIDYFLTDYFVALGYEKIDTIKNLINSVPLNNPELYWLKKHFRDKFNKKDWDNMCELSYAYKLNWRISGVEEGSYGWKILSSNDVSSCAQL